VGTSGNFWGKSFSNNFLVFDGGSLCQLFNEYVGTSWIGELKVVSKFQSSHKCPTNFPSQDPGGIPRLGSGSQTQSNLWRSRFYSGARFL
jgi:hypothetical protein